MLPPIYRIKMCTVYKDPVSKIKGWGAGVGSGASSGSVETMDRGSCAAGPFEGPGVHQQAHRQPTFPFKCLVSAWMGVRSETPVNQLVTVKA
jgi:hypothetical protein